MKHYKLTAWPELQAPYHRTGYRRMLCDMSHRFVSVQHLASVSGLAKAEVRQFLQMLAGRGLLDEREQPRESDSLLDSLRPLGAWLANAFGSELGGRRS